MCVEHGDQQPACKNASVGLVVSDALALALAPARHPEADGSDAGSDSEARAAKVAGSSTVASGFELRFASECADFKGVYQRNNKRGGLKNLRCFPTCAEAHRERGFCGQKVQVEFRRMSAEGADAESAGSLRCWGQFVQAGAAQTEAQVRAQAQKQKCAPVIDPAVGDEVAATLVASLQRAPGDIKKPLVPGDEEEGAPGRWVLNRRLKGWHYSWVANKHTCNAEHCFRVYAFEEVAGGKLRCVGVVSSPSFRLFCRRRKRFEIKPSAPLAPVGAPAAESLAATLKSPKSKSKSKPKPKPKRKYLKRALPQPCKRAPVESLQDPEFDSGLHHSGIHSGLNSGVDPEHDFLVQFGFDDSPLAEEPRRPAGPEELAPPLKRARSFLSSDGSYFDTDSEASSHESACGDWGPGVEDDVFMCASDVLPDLADFEDLLLGL